MGEPEPEQNMDLFEESKDEETPDEEDEEPGPKRVPLETVCSTEDAGKKGKSGVEIKAAFLLDAATNKVQLKLSITN